LRSLGTIAGAGGQKEGEGAVNGLRGFKWHAAASLAVALLVVAGALTLAACGGGEFTPPSDLPGWPPDASPSPAVSIPAGTAAYEAEWHQGRGTDGWEFRPYVDIEVTALGYFDYKGDGLVRPHDAGVFDTAKKHLIVSAKVDSESTLDGAYRWESVEPPWVLEAGHPYVVAVYGEGPPGDVDTANRPAGTVWAPWIKHGKYHANHNPWGFPEVDIGEAFVLTANFKFKPVSAVSPSP
jgi:hypothetical protein